MTEEVGRRIAKRFQKARRPRMVCRLGLTVACVGLLALAARAEELATSPALPSALASETLLLDAAHAGKRVVAVGSWGHVVLSDDGGLTWRQARSTPTRSVLTDVSFPDAKNGWAVGHDGVVIRTRDGGETWVLQRAEPADETPLFSVWFENEKSGLAVGAFGLALRTNDAGETWERFGVGNDGDDLHLNEVFAAGGSERYIAAESGAVYRSVDSGTTWTLRETPYEGSFWGGLDAGDGAILVFGLRGHILRSTDGGETWTAIDSGTDQSLGGGARLEDGTIVVAGLGGVVVRSRDGGRTFEATTRASRRGSQSVVGGANGRLLFFGESGVEVWAGD